MTNLRLLIVFLRRLDSRCQLKFFFLACSVQFCLGESQGSLEHGIVKRLSCLQVCCSGGNVMRNTGLLLLANDNNLFYPPSNVLKVYLLTIGNKTTTYNLSYQYHVFTLELCGFGLIQSKSKSNPFNLDLDWIWIRIFKWIWIWIWI